MAGSSLLVTEALAQALPAGGQVAAGSGTITQTAANALLVRQATDRLAINWQSFNIGAGNSVRFEQPSASSIALNRVVGTSRSEIYGNLSSNGQVFLLNPNGVLFGRTAQVDVGGLVATTLKLTDRDFLDGHFIFNDSASSATITNQGNLRSRDGGYLALVGNRVINEGTMEAHRGSVVLGAGGSARLTLADNRLVSFEVTQGALDALAENGGLIRANGGQVIMTAGARDSLLASAVNNTGVIEAQTVERQPGNVLLLSGMAAGTTTVGGRIDASAPAATNPNGGDGGFVETSGAHVKVIDSARIDRRADNGRAGTWLIDPTDYTVAATGGDISGAALSANLALGDVSILSSSGTVCGSTGNGDINVNDAVSWNANTLTLTAARDVNINAVMTPGGTSSLSMNASTANGGSTAVPDGFVRTGFNPDGTFKGRVDFGARTGSGFLTINGDAYTVINALGVEGSRTRLDLEGTNGASSGNFALGADIDAAPSAGWYGGTGWRHIGMNANFNGLGHVVRNLTINAPADIQRGLFGFAGTSDPSGPRRVISNVGVEGSPWVVKANTGGVVGLGSNVAIVNSYANVDIATPLGETDGYLGGLVGRLARGLVSNSHSSGFIYAEAAVGGLVGNGIDASIIDSYATGRVHSRGLSGSTFVGLGSFFRTAGGLVGTLNGGTILRSFATGNVIGGGTNGGLVGAASSDLFFDSSGNLSATHAEIRDSYATGDVFASGSSSVGGLVGVAQANIRNSHATGSVTGGNSLTGGLVGALSMPEGITDPYTAPPVIENSWASGLVSGHSAVGGLVGSVSLGAIRSSRASGAVNGITWVGGLVGCAGLAFRGGTCDGVVEAASIYGSYATGNVTGTGNEVGGLVGKSVLGSVTASFATGAVSGLDHVGGLIGFGGVGPEIAFTYATGSVSGRDYVGGLIGWNDNQFSPFTTISQSYATGAVTGRNYVGGLAGYVSNGDIVSSYALAGTVSATGAFVEPLLTGPFATTTDSRALSAAEMKSNGSFVGFGWSAWRLYEGHTTPLLRNFMTPLVLPDTTVAYNGSVQSGATITRPNVFGTPASGRNASASLYSPDYWSDQLGYDIFNGFLTINKANVQASGLVAGNKIYDSTTAATLTGTASVSAFGSDVLNVTGTAVGSFANKNVGNAKAVTVSGLALGGADAGNYNLVQPQGLTANITPATLAVSGLSAANKTYDGTTAATLVGTAAISAIGSDVVTLGGTAAGAFADKNVGAGKAVTVSGLAIGGTDAGNYTLLQPSGLTADIGAKALTIGGITAANRTYDGTTAATVSTAGATYAGLVLGDAVTVNATGAFVNKNVGVGKTVNLTSSYSGADVNNYSITGQAITLADIGAKALTIGGIVASNKTYDGTTAATVSTTGATYAGLVAGDAVTVSATGTFGDKNAGLGKIVTLASSYTGADVSNYSITNQASTTADISAKSLTVGGITASNKTYDGTTATTVSTAGATYAGLVSGDAVSVSATGVFGDKNVGTGKTVTLTSSYTGADVGNYSITNQAGTTANISARALTVGGLTASSKVYDGSDSATVSTAGATYTGLVSGDAVTVSATGEFIDKNVGTAKAVMLASSYTGADVANYSITTQAITTADISAKALTIGGITASNKTYDGTNLATVSTAGVTYGGLVSGDAVTVNATGTFANRNVGTAKTVTLASSYTGADVGNYSITGQASTTADIAAKALTIGGITASNKTYDGTTLAAVSTAGAIYAGLISGDAVTVNASGTFSNKNVGTAKTVTLSSSYSGSDVANYSITDQASTTADITAKALTIGGITASNKTYDGTTTATVSTAGATYAGLVSGDAVTVSATGTFANKNVGTARTVTLSSSYTGSDVGNYSITNQSSATADISSKSLSIGGITAANKTYDGTTSATVSTAGASYVGLVAGDAVAVNATGVFANKNVGTGKTVTLSSSYTGADVGNYSIAGQASTTADIAARTLTIGGLAAANKTYDGTTSATVSTSGATYAGLVSGDVVTISSAGSFDTRNAGVGKTVTATFGGADAANYLIAQPAGLVADITPRLATVTVNDLSKPYGTSYSFAGTEFTATGLVVGERIDRVNLSSLGAAAGATVAASPYVIVASAAQGGNFAAGNYNVTYVPGRMTVDPATLLVSARPLTRTFDGTAFAGGNGVDFSGFANGESASALGGLLSYGGSSQGAVGVGRYLIVPGGLTAANYSITYRPGELSIEPVLTTRAAGAQAAITAVQSSLRSPVPGNVTNDGAGAGGSTQGSVGTGNLPSVESLSTLPPTRSGPRTRLAALLNVVGSGQKIPEGVE